jgi:outer membrane protein TolC
MTQLALATVLALSLIAAHSAESPATNAPAWLSTPLSLPQALEIVLRQNPNILRGKSDINAAYGVVLQTRAIVFPRVRSTGSFTGNDPGLIESFPSTVPIVQSHDNWTVNIQILQSIYEGGRLHSALRSAKLTRDQALAQYEVVVADTVLQAETAYYDVLVAGELIGVQEASVNLLIKVLSDTRNRFEAGTVPQFNVLRAEVELANARPRLIRAKNASRIAKNNLATVLGYDVPKEVWEDIPLQLSDKLEAQPMKIQLPAALGQALQRRPELTVLRKSEGLRREDIVNSRAGYKPSLQIFGGYGVRSSTFFEDLTREEHGWTSGVQFTWDIFDGLLTRGRVKQAEALLERARVDVSDTGRRIEQEVRTAYSTFIEAQEVLESQKKVQEQAEEALRLAIARNEAGAGTQLDVLSAQTALTEARSTQVQALHDYEVARARLERAIGQNITVKKEAGDK